MAFIEAAVATAEKVGSAASEAVKKTAEIVKKGAEITKDVSEITKEQVESIKNPGDAVRLKLNDIKNLTPEQLREAVEQKVDNTENCEPSDAKEKTSETEELTNEEKIKIKEETGWSDEMIDSIESMDEYEIYKNAGLQEAEIGGKNCLIRNDIDWSQKDTMGRTNQERAEQGLSPINKDGKIVELHHIGQRADSPLAELTPEEHRGKGNDTILHNKSKESEIDRNVFAGEKDTHWEIRKNEGGNS